MSLGSVHGNDLLVLLVLVVRSVRKQRGKHSVTRLVCDDIRHDHSAPLRLRLRLRATADSRF